MRRTSVSRSPRSTVVFAQSLSGSVRETTYFGMAVIRAPRSAAISGGSGQKAAQMLNVRLPISNASAPMIWPPLYSWSSGSLTRMAQPFRPVGCSSKPGACMTPSRVMNSTTTSFMGPG
jgi:hypothetical protein